MSSYMATILKVKKEIIYQRKKGDLLRKMAKERLMREEMVKLEIIEVLEKDINLNTLI